MNVKAAALIFLFIFATIATTYVVEISTSQTSSKNFSFNQPSSVVQLYDMVEPQEEIDTPAMPT